ncbi:reverse transcriptase domain-containing protein, partial [Mycobacterium kansasii]
YGFAQSVHDTCLFTKITTTGFTALLLYVDDVLVAGNDLTEIESLKKSLHYSFTIKDLGKAKYFLGLEIAQTSTGIYIDQRKYTLDLV